MGSERPRGKSRYTGDVPPAASVDVLYQDILTRPARVSPVIGIEKCIKEAFMVALRRRKAWLNERRKGETRRC